MKTQGNSGGTTARKRAIIIAITLLLAGGIGTTIFLANGGDGKVRSNVEKEKLENERLLGDKLQLEKRLNDQEGSLRDERTRNTDADARIADLERRVKQAQDHARTLEGKARSTDKAKRDIAEALAQRDKLMNQLAGLQSSERELRDQLAQARADRDAIAARFDQQQQGAQMVNNAEVDAVRGKKERLTVVAKRTREIRMAFDLPQHMAQQASFKIITPKGKAYEGNDPAIAMTFDQPEAEPLAAVNMTEGLAAGARASRVHLKFSPKGKLEPGQYRIDVRSGDTYLNTVLLRLR
jgi:hypothetical protein